MLENIGTALALLNQHINRPTTADLLIALASFQPLWLQRIG
jgi:hypothetical protein